jgi:hypothetical protein
MAPLGPRYCIAGSVRARADWVRSAKKKRKLGRQRRSCKLQAKYSKRGLRDAASAGRLRARSNDLRVSLLCWHYAASLEARGPERRAIPGLHHPDTAQPISKPGDNEVPARAPAVSETSFVIPLAPPANTGEIQPGSSFYRTERASHDAQDRVSPALAESRVAAPKTPQPTLGIPPPQERALKPSTDSRCQKRRAECHA